jgi:hypothetical protein
VLEFLHLAQGGAHFRVGLQQLVLERMAVFEVGFLGQVAHGGAVGQADFSAVGVFDPGQDAQQGGLAAPVGSDEGQAFALLNVQRDTAQDFPSAKAELDVDERDHNRMSRWPVGRTGERLWFLIGFAGPPVRVRSRRSVASLFDQPGVGQAGQIGLFRIVAGFGRTSPGEEDGLDRPQAGGQFGLIVDHLLPQGGGEGHEGRLAVDQQVVPRLVGGQNERGRSGAAAGPAEPLVGVPAQKHLGGVVGHQEAVLRPQQPEVAFEDGAQVSRFGPRTLDQLFKPLQERPARGDLAELDAFLEIAVFAQGVGKGFRIVRAGEPQGLTGRGRRVVLDQIERQIHHRVEPGFRFPVEAPQDRVNGAFGIGPLMQGQGFEPGGALVLDPGPRGLHFPVQDALRRLEQFLRGEFLKTQTGLAPFQESVPVCRDVLFQTVGLDLSDDAVQEPAGEGAVVLESEETGRADGLARHPRHDPRVARAGGFVHDREGHADVSGALEVGLRGEGFPGRAWR